MEKLTRKSGIDNIGDIHWSSRLCVLYRNEDELINIIVPYFKDGLKNNELCLWITSSPLFKVNMENALKKYITCLNILVNGQMKIVPQTAWYLAGGSSDEPKMIKNGMLN